MTKEYNRAKRVAQEMRKKIAIILQHNITDPSLGMATVSEVKVSRDLAYAKVFVTFLNNKTPEQIKNSLLVLQEATGVIRNLLSKTICLRMVPKLTFTYDHSLVEGIRISNLVSQVAQHDRQYSSENMLKSECCAAKKENKIKENL